MLALRLEPGRLLAREARLAVPRRRPLSSLRRPLLSSPPRWPLRLGRAAEPEARLEPGLGPVLSLASLLEPGPVLVPALSLGLALRLEPALRLEREAQLAAPRRQPLFWPRLRLPLFVRQSARPQ